MPNSPIFNIYNKISITDTSEAELSFMSQVKCMLNFVFSDEFITLYK